MELPIKSDLIAPAAEDIELTAIVPTEMIVAQQQLITWCDGKLFVIRKEAQELHEATEHAKMMKWKYTTLQSQHTKALKRISYYEKIKAALLQGYYIIPNFDVEIFAIRTDRDRPQKFLSTDRWNRKRSEQPAHDMPLGEGDYKNNRPVIFEREIDGKVKEYWANSWEDVEFPVNMCKPLIMEATTKAMEKKIFDRFGVFPSSRKKIDPVIIGQIVHKEGQYRERIVSFMIAWHLNTNVL